MPLSNNRSHKHHTFSQVLCSGATTASVFENNKINIFFIFAYHIKLGRQGRCMLTEHYAALCPIIYIHIFYFSIGRPKHIRVMAGALEGELFVGPRAEEHRGLLSIKYPMEHGIVTDWNDMERVWNYIYSKVG